MDISILTLVLDKIVITIIITHANVTTYTSTLIVKRNNGDYRNFRTVYVYGSKRLE